MIDSTDQPTEPAPEAITEPRSGRGLLPMWLSIVSYAVVAISGVCFAHGQRTLVLLPGEPRMDQLPDTPEVAAALRWLWVSLGLAGVSLVLALVAGVLGRRVQDEDTRGVWAWVMAACWPLLVIVLIGGISAR